MKLIKFVPFTFFLIIVFQSGCDKSVEPESYPEIICNIELSTDSVNIRVGESQEIFALLTSPHGNDCDNGVSWESNDTTIASIEPISKTDAIIAPHSEGATTISARSNDDEDNVSEAVVNVFPEILCEVETSVDSLVLEMGESKEISASVFSPNGSECNNGVIWKVDNKEIISITEIDEHTASIKALEEGEVSVTAESIDDSEAFDQVNIEIIFGEVVVYSAHTPFNEDIFITNRNKDQKVIVSSSRQHLHPKWFNDGTKIAYFTYESNGTAIYSVDSNGKEKSTLIKLNLITTFDITEDGKHIVMSSKEKHSDPKELHHLNLETGDITRLTFEGEGKSGISRGPSFPVWSPNGSKIAFQTHRDGNWEIYIMDSNGKNVKNLTNTSNKHEYKPQWSPEGSRIVFVSGPEGQGNNIEVINTDGTERFSVTNGIYPSWVNEDRIIFSRYEDGIYNIITSDLHGNNSVTIQDKGWSKVLVQWKPGVEWYND